MPTACPPPDWTAIPGGKDLAQSVARLWGWDPEAITDEQFEQIKERIEDWLT